MRVVRRSPAPAASSEHPDRRPPRPPRRPSAAARRRRSRSARRWAWWPARSWWAAVPERVLELAPGRASSRRSLPVSSWACSSPANGSRYCSSPTLWASASGAALRARTVATAATREARIAGRFLADDRWRHGRRLRLVALPRRGLAMSRSCTTSWSICAVPTASSCAIADIWPDAPIYTAVYDEHGHRGPVRAPRRADVVPAAAEAVRVHVPLAPAAVSVRDRVVRPVRATTSSCPARARGRTR